MTKSELSYWQDWKPDQVAVDFMLGLINSSKGGWKLPANGTVYRFDRERKAFVLVEGSVDHLFYMNKKVLEAVGWTIEVAPEAALATGAGKTQVASMRELFSDFYRN